jgi:hypothetical protein
MRQVKDVLNGGFELGDKGTHPKLITALRILLACSLLGPVQLTWPRAVLF